METFMNHTFARAVCALALSATTGCASFDFSYVEDAVLPIVVQDVGSACETDDPVDTDLARVHVEQDGDMCVITGDALVRAIEYDDLAESLDTVDLQGDDTYWDDGGICWQAATDADAGKPYEKCDFRPYVQAEWRLVGEDAWSSNPDFPDQATVVLDIRYYPASSPGRVDEEGDGLPPGMSFDTNGQEFPAGGVGLTHAGFWDPFQEAVGPDQEDLYSFVHARVEVPMSDIADFTEHEYKISFAYQMYVAGSVEHESLLELMFAGLFGGEN
jgi:hypothetical protein